MRAFVSGGSGFIGSHLIETLVEQGWKVRALVHKTPLNRAQDVEIVIGDICNRHALEEGMEGVNIVFHLASALGWAVIGNKEFQRINVEGTAAMLETARFKRIPRFLHVSSAGVLGSVAGGDAADETFPPRPVSIYDRTKREAEELALNACSSGLDVTVVRPGWVYGPRDRRTFKLIRTICRGKLLFLPFGRARQTPVYIEDLIAGMLLAAQSGQTGHIYHLAGGQILSAVEIVTAIGRACGRKGRPLFIPLLAARLAALMFEIVYAPLKKEPPFSRSKLSFFIHSKPLSINKARSELGFRPNVDFEQGLKLTLSWYEKAGWL